MRKSLGAKCTHMDLPRAVNNDPLFSADCDLNFFHVAAILIAAPTCGRTPGTL
jgi:hypothetical protein